MVACPKMETEIIPGSPSTSEASSRIKLQQPSMLKAMSGSSLNINPGVFGQTGSGKLFSLSSPVMCFAGSTWTTGFLFLRPRVYLGSSGWAGLRFR